MSWAGIASNQCVSFANLQDAVATGVFMAAEASVPPGSKQITKAEAQQYVVINTISGKSNNQLVVKSNLTAKTGVYKWSLSSNGSTSGGACALILEQIAWTNTATPTTGTVFYADYNLTTIFPMSGYSGLFLHYKSYGAAGNGFYARFNLSTSTINNSPASC